MSNLRPKNLNLFTIHFPFPAIISILHRLSGFFLFLLIPMVLWSLDYSLTLSGFEDIKRWMDGFFVKLLIWVLLVPFCFHLVAGVRHLLMDMRIGDNLQTGRKMAKGVLIVSLICIVWVGIWLW